MNNSEKSANIIQNAILSIDYSSPNSLIEEILQKKKNDLLLKLQIENIIKIAFKEAQN
ncbi:hypothetical protein ACW2B4_11770 [Acinetobacter pittii]